MKIGQEGPMIEIRNPATSEKITELKVSTNDEVARAVNRSREAQGRWQEYGFHDRAAFLYRFRDLLLDNREKMTDIVTAETGKPRAEFYGAELFYICDAIGFWAKYAPRFIKPKKIRPHLLKTKKVYSIYQPFGVVGIISPWNFPLALTLGDAIPALMAGNGVVIKPSELTPMSALFGSELAAAAGLPQGVIQIVVGAAETGEALIDSADMIAFTGSVETGKKVMRRAADRLIPVSLELGGKDPMIVLKDGNIERAVNACVWGALMNSGQVCSSIERVYVEGPVYDEFVRRVVESVKSLRQRADGNQAELGSMTSAEQVKKVEHQLEDAVRKGARILTGGRRPPGDGLCFPPTVLVDVTHEMAIMTEETFGPVIPIMQVKDREEALRLANDSLYGLDSSVFTRDKETGWKLAQKLETGSVCINDSLVNFVILDVPMGGIKSSGFGRRHGAEGIRKYCRQKTIVIDRLGLKSEPTWFPNSHRKTSALRSGLTLLFRSGWKNKLTALGRLFRG
ncbi:MAG: aldehyde dehydrogenase family protein [Deltaproteobacteria bacterium]|nr:aldehyde dehydrogenase family protein [Deltaproteobacteria bacterium]